MILHKIFHIKQSLESAKASLEDLRSYRPRLEDVHRINVTSDDVSSWSFSIPGHGGLSLKAERLTSPNPNLLLFASIEGDLELQAMVEFVPVRDSLTQVEITLHYRFKSLFHRIMDWLSGSTEHFVNRQLKAIRTHFEGMESVVRHSSPVRRTMRRLQPVAAAHGI